MKKGTNFPTLSTKFLCGGRGAPGEGGEGTGARGWRRGDNPKLCWLTGASFDAREGNHGGGGGGPVSFLYREGVFYFRPIQLLTNFIWFAGGEQYFGPGGPHSAPISLFPPRARGPQGAWGLRGGGTSRRGGKQGGFEPSSQGAKKKKGNRKKFGGPRWTLINPFGQVCSKGRAGMLDCQGKGGRGADRGGGPRPAGRDGGSQKKIEKGGRGGAPGPGGSTAFSLRNFEKNVFPTAKISWAGGGERVWGSFRGFGKPARKRGPSAGGFNDCPAETGPKGRGGRTTGKKWGTDPRFGGPVFGGSRGGREKAFRGDPQRGQSGGFWGAPGRAGDGKRAFSFLPQGFTRGCFQKGGGPATGWGGQGKPFSPAGRGWGGAGSGLGRSCVFSGGPGYHPKKKTFGGFF